MSAEVQYGREIPLRGGIHSPYQPSEVSSDRINSITGASGLRWGFKEKGDLSRIMLGGGGDSTIGYYG